MMTREVLRGSGGLNQVFEQGGQLDRDGVEPSHLLAAARLSGMGLWWTWAGVCQLGLAVRAAVPGWLHLASKA